LPSWASRSAPFSTILQEESQDLSLASSTAATVRELAQNPTGAVDVASLQPKVEAVANSSYTIAFHRVMIISAVLAAAGGLVAFATIRGPSDA
jgi:hypothetical protein